MVRRLSIVTVALIVTLPFLTPRTVDGQRVPANALFTPMAVELAAPDTPASREHPLVSSTAPDPLLVPHRHDLPVDTATKSLRRRLLPYAVVGAVVGGGVTYAVMPKSCDVSENMFCQYTLASIPIIGAAAGGWIGLLVGYLRERR